MAVFGLALRKLTLFAVAVSLALAPLPTAVAEGAMEAAGYAAVAEQDTAGHGHSHDGNERHEHPAGHTHGHDPADHSHQYAFLSGGSNQWGLPPAQRWPSTRSGKPEAAMAMGIERPPKRKMSL
jgi:hypothetical protein